MGNKGQTTIIPGEMTKMNRARMANLRRNTYIPNEMLSNVTAEVKESPNIFTGFNGAQIVNNYRKETNETILPGVSNPALAELRKEAPVEEKSFFDFSNLFGSKGGRRLTRKSRSQRKRRTNRKQRTIRKKSSIRSRRSTRK
jgi:hypothetical protein